MDVKGCEDVKRVCVKGVKGRWDMIEGRKGKM